VLLGNQEQIDLAVEQINIAGKAGLQVKEESPEVSQ
jgi:hypothetical protein